MSSDNTKYVVTSAPEVEISRLRVRLLSLGFSVDESFDEIGVLTGYCSADKALQIKQLREVADVKRDGEVDILPPPNDQ